MAFLPHPPLPLAPRPRPPLSATRPPRRPPPGGAAGARGQVRDIGGPGDFEAALRSTEVAVVKFWAGYCRCCLGVAGRYRRLARGWQQEAAAAAAAAAAASGGGGAGQRGLVGFWEMDFGSHRDFCQAEGVEKLPLFRVYRHGVCVRERAVGREGMARLEDDVFEVVSEATAQDGRGSK